MFLMSFMGNLLMCFVIQFLEQLLQDPNYYNVPQDKVSTIYGDISMWSNLAALLFLSVIGIGYDTFGRKIFYLIAFANAGICLICFPLSKTVYPDFLVMRLFYEFSLRILMNNPLVADYIDEKS